MTALRLHCKASLRSDSYNCSKLPSKCVCLVTAPVTFPDKQISALTLDAPVSLGLDGGVLCLWSQILMGSGKLIDFQFA
jgi:hypothetical protein